eukprot:393461_1
MAISLYWVYKRPSDTRSEREFHQKWYKWKKQYMWHELWYRSHVLWILSLIVVFIFEPGWPAWIPVVLIFFFVAVTICLKIVARKVEARVPSNDLKTQLYKGTVETIRSASDARDYADIVPMESDISTNDKGESNDDDETTKNTKKNETTTTTQSKMAKGIELQEKK